MNIVMTENSLDYAIYDLHQQVVNYSINHNISSATIFRCTASFSKKNDFSLLGFLADQKSYPQMYWQTPDNSEKRIAFGMLKNFVSVDAVQEHCLANPLAKDQKIWGGCGFSVNDMVFFSFHKLNYLNSKNSIILLLILLVISKQHLML